MHRVRAGRRGERSPGQRTSRPTPRAGGARRADSARRTPVLVNRGKSAYDVVDFEIIWEILADNVPVVATRVRVLLEP